MKHFLLTALLGLLLLCAPWAAQASSADDAAIFQQYLAQMSAKKDLPPGDLMVETARFFLGRPYVADTLEKEPESLVINLRELDCMTLVETAAALSRTLRDKSPSFATYAKHLQDMRYREGKIRDYTDRLHYTTDWVYENQKRGRMKDVTQEIGGQAHAMHVSFVTDQPDLFKQLRGQPQLVAVMARQEKAINARQHYYIPQAAINQHAAQIKNGDIVSFVTSRKGLDVSHMGIVYHEKGHEGGHDGGRMTFIHASTRAKRVVIEEKSLQEYAQSVPKNMGILIVRPQF